MTGRLVLLLRRHCSSLSSPKTNPAPERPEPLKAIINRLFEVRDPDALVAVFNSTASARPRFRSAHNIYSASVRRLVAAGRADLVRTLLDHQKQFPNIQKEGFAYRLLILYGVAHLPEDALATFRQLPSLGCHRTVKSFNALLSACYGSKAIDLVADLFTQIPSEEPSILPNLFSYNILIKAHCEKPDLDAAFETLKLMEANGISPDLGSLNILMNGCYDNGRVADAEKVWALMGEKRIQPDTLTFNAKLRWLVSEGRTSDAAQIVDEMRKCGPKPDAHTSYALIKGYCKDGKLEEAKRVYMESMDNGCAPIHSTLQLLIPKLCENGEIDLALVLCTDCLGKKCDSDAAVLQAVVDGFVKDSKLEEAKKLLDFGWKNGCSRKALMMPLA